MINNLYTLMINLNHSKRNIVLGALLFAAQMTFSSMAFAGGTVWEGNSTSNPTNVEAISGTSFAATAAFTDWAQTQSVAAGAGISLGFNVTAVNTHGDIYLANFQTNAGQDISVTAGSYVALSFGTVGSDYSITIDSTYVDSYQANYHETNSTDHTGYVVLYLKLKAFTLLDGGTENAIKLAEVSAGTLGVLSNNAVNHTNLMNEGTDPGGNVLVSSGLADSTPEIPPQALPAVYSGLGAGLWTLRNRFARKKQKKNDKK